MAERGRLTSKCPWCSMQVSAPLSELFSPLGRRKVENCCFCQRPFVVSGALWGTFLGGFLVWAATGIAVFIIEGAAASAAKMLAAVAFLVFVGAGISLKFTGAGEVPAKEANSE